MTIDKAMSRNFSRAQLKSMYVLDKAVSRNFFDLVFRELK